MVFSRVSHLQGNLQARDDKNNVSVLCSALLDARGG